jgi:hypothetical protein
MKIQLVRLLVASLAFWASDTSVAATYYVNANSANPLPPYSSWATAATNIQDAIDAANAGDLIEVTNGVYRIGVVATNAITIQSVNGMSATWIDGNQTTSCANLAGGAVLTGFTLTNGLGFNGGGVLCADTSVFVSSCLLISNSAPGNYGGGAFSGTLSNCTLVGNNCRYGGGGAAWSVLNNCTLSANTAEYGGGASEATLNNCVLTGNQAWAGGGAIGSLLNNCLVARNSAYNPNSSGAALGAGAFGVTANNCTIVSNRVILSYAIDGGGTYGGTMNNCIIYANKVGGGTTNYSGGTFTNCCTTPLPANGVNNFTNAPLFVNQAGGDFHLQSDSPCINSGNNAYVTGATDLDGNPRIVGGTVDIGAYEFQTPVSMISYAWLQQYGLPITTNTDTADLDGTGMSIYQDWIAGLNPTNPASVLAMLPLVSTNNPSGLVVSWQSVNTRTYYLQSSTNLAMRPAFSSIQSNIVGQAGTTSYTDTNAVGSGPYFYRVGVQ